MERNPYAPPVSAVADPVEVRSERPKEVALAVKLLWCSFLVGVVAIFLRPQQQEPFVVVLIVCIVVGAFWAWVITLIASGTNWARILFFVMTGIGVIVGVLLLKVTLPIYTAHPVSGAVAALNYTLQICALYLLLTAPARAWFNQPAP